MDMCRIAQTPEVTTTDEVPLTEEKTSKVEEKMFKSDENTSNESEEKPSEVMGATTTLPTLSSFGKAACCHQGLAR